MPACTAQVANSRAARTLTFVTGALFLVELTAGCHWLGDDAILRAGDPGELSFPSVEMPDFAGDPSDSPAFTFAEPPRLGRFNRHNELGEADVRPLGLQEALHTALSNVAVVRDRHSFLSASNSLLTSPDQAASVFDVPIRRSSDWGIDAAQAAFDPRVTAGGQWGRNALIPASGFLANGFPARDIFVSESGSIFGRIDKPLSSGTVFSVVHGWNYSPTAATGSALDARFAGFVRGEIRQPLWAGFGREVTNISGPAALQAGSSNVGRGVVVARLDEQISVEQFEARLQVLLKQTEELYWDLWLAHQTYRSLAAASAAAERIWQRVKNRAVTGLAGGGAADEAQAQEHFLAQRQRADDALAEVLKLETQLRRLMGLPVNQGQILRPTDQPSVAELVPDWDASLVEALYKRVELRQQKTRIEMLELQLRAARNLSHPQLDLVSGVQVNGAGQRLWDSSAGGPGAYDSLLQTDEPGWNIGFEFSMPLGFVAERAQIREHTNRLAKARAVLREQQVEISHELTFSLHELDRTFTAVETSAQRRMAAQRRLRAVQADYDAGRSSLDLLLRSQLAVSEADVAHATSIVHYNRAILELQYRKGAILDHNEVAIADVDDLVSGSSHDPITTGVSDSPPAQELLPSPPAGPMTQ